MTTEVIVTARWSRTTSRLSSGAVEEVAVDAEPFDPGALLTPAEVAAILFVDPKTVTRWARAGKLNCFRTPGGHRRFL
ncbi:MAG: binding domain protein excisionase family, partial [Marmoricola sp.]|nr:binding domain protein excisionase family [Marmoricola sp.]